MPFENALNRCRDCSVLSYFFSNWGKLDRDRNKPVTCLTSSRLYTKEVETGSDGNLNRHPVYWIDRPLGGSGILTGGGGGTTPVYSKAPRSHNPSAPRMLPSISVLYVWRRPLTVSFVSVYPAFVAA